mmetsp:Transcript_2770/g.2760  ORF Transcript_2770/g.2760 Transcript_2770/m.2760 type:complete len:245 (-) Transcript_2770:135-869(-)
MKKKIIMKLILQKNSLSPTSIQLTNSDLPTLLSLWYTGPMSVPMKSNSSGILAYEISLQQGIVIRTSSNSSHTQFNQLHNHSQVSLQLQQQNPSEIEDDTMMWSMIYLYDILHSSSNSKNWTCFDFFSIIFPQFPQTIYQLTNGKMDELSSIGMKYCTHYINSFDELTNNSSDNHLPPLKVIPSTYQTIGKLSDSATRIIARFQGDVPIFHDFYLFNTSPTSVDTVSISSSTQHQVLPHDQILS